MATKQNVIERAKRMVRMVKKGNANDAQQGKA
jgi:hypothetical protein